jgi:Sucrase/ferredoxin-like
MSHVTCWEESPGDLPEPPALRCADAARMRGEPLAAIAARYSRFLLLEVPGPWGSSALDAGRADAGAAGHLERAAAAADCHVVLIRRTGRQPAAGGGRGPRAWALADTSPAAERVLWGRWRDYEDLLGLDLTAPVPDAAGASGPQRVALVCTNGKRDQCCAIRGRPVATVVAAGSDWDTWECSHLGGHRFAATILLLPTGDMFGWLDPGSALEVVRRFGEGNLMLAYHRGRSGQPRPVQAALQAAAVRLGESRRDAIRPAWARHVPAAERADRWEVGVLHGCGDAGIAYRVIVDGSRQAPGLLTCADDVLKAETRYEAVSFSRG